jgi:serine/threonine-protein kinase RsbT
MNESIDIKNRVELEICIIQSEFDIVKTRQTVRYYAKQFNMGIVDQTRITTAVSELFRNMYQYANGGEVIIEKGDFKGKLAIIITCVDHGPGIDDLEAAMRDGYTSGSGMGYGLPGSKRLVDDFHIVSKINHGTTVRVLKWI